MADLAARAEHLRWEAAQLRLDMPATAERLQALADQLDCIRGQEGGDG